MPLFNPTFNAGTSATCTETNVASSASAVSFLSANASRKGFTVFNDSTSVLYLGYTSDVTASKYRVQVLAGGYFESESIPTWQGVVYGIWASANGYARINELS